uniref:VPS9 domain containing 1 n=1 Tax=Tetraodon nigroviridis TaxID=99883 RepID=H3CTV4_TETNG
VTMAAADSGAKPIQNAMKMAKAAIQLDGGNKHKEAYCEYLRTINYISHSLLEEAVSQILATEDMQSVSLEVERMLRLAEQCLERAKSFLAASVASPDTAVDSDEDTSPTRSGDCRVISDEGRMPPPFVPPEIFQRLQTVESQDTSKKELTPIEEASRINQKLRANYEARLARLTPGQAYQKTSLTLSLQRQMMENLIIAKARQDALQRKMEDRRLRLQEEANRRFAASGTVTAEEQEQRILYTNVLEYEQDHDWPKQWKANIRKNPDDISLVSGLVSYLLSQSDHPVVKLLRKHQYRIYNRLYPIISKGLSKSPGPSSRSTHSLHPGGLPFNIRMITVSFVFFTETQRKPIRSVDSSFGGQSFSTGSSPSLSHDLHTSDDYEQEEDFHAEVARENSFEDLEQFLEQDEQNLQELETRALKEHLKAVVKDIHIAIDQLLSLCLLSFESLNTAKSKDLCLASIEEAFFTPLWAALVALFRKVYTDREQAYDTSVKLYQNASPGDVGVPLRLFPQEPGALQGSYPYESAVQELKLLTADTCPQRKLECVVRTLRLICACAEDYSCLNEGESTPKAAAIGADDLLPILSYVALQSQCPQLVSECAALEEFIHESYLIGEEGYCLTSLRSALAYVESL